MATLTAEDVKELRKLPIKVEKIITLLEGNGGEGLLQKSDNNTKRITRIEIIIAGLLGTGGLGFGLLKLFGG